MFLLNTIGPDADVVVIVNKVVGISAAVLVTMQYVPQIFATCRLKVSLSISYSPSRGQRLTFFLESGIAQLDNAVHHRFGLIPDRLLLGLFLLTRMVNLAA